MCHSEECELYLEGNKKLLKDFKGPDIEMKLDIKEAHVLRQNLVSERRRGEGARRAGIQDSSRNQVVLCPEQEYMRGQG